MPEYPSLLDLHPCVYQIVEFEKAFLTDKVDSRDPTDPKIHSKFVHVHFWIEVYLYNKM